MSDQSMERDHIIRVTAENEQIRAAAITGKQLAEAARTAHRTSPLATAALGRLLCGTAMMGREMLKNDGDLITVQIDGDGPLKGLLATADSAGNVKGYVKNPWVILPNKADGHLDVGGGVGRGILSVTRDMGMNDPYSGQVELRSGEIAEDLTYYFAASEQTPSSVGLGVLVDGQGQVLEAGGYIIQLMPFAAEEVIDRLERNIRALPAVTEMLREDRNPESLLSRALDGFSLHRLDETDVHWHCNCSRDRVERALMLIGKTELDQMILDGKGEELRCRFCNKAYPFSVEDLKRIREIAK